MTRISPQLSLQVQANTNNTQDQNQTLVKSCLESTAFTYVFPMTVFGLTFAVHFITET